MISEFPLFVFTTFAGIAAGAYVVAAVFPAKSESKRAWAFPLALLALLGIGLIGCLMHLQHPERFLNALFNPTAGITLEAYFSLLLGLVLFADIILCLRKKIIPRWLRLFGALIAFILTCIMGYAYFISYGVEAWSTWATVPLFFVGDLAMGAGLYGLFQIEQYKRRSFILASISVEVLLAIVLIVEAVHFSGRGLSFIPFLVALAISPVLVTGLTLAARKRASFAMSAAICICSIAGVAIARYAFYAGYLL